MHYVCISCRILEVALVISVSKCHEYDNKVFPCVRGYKSTLIFGSLNIGDEDYKQDTKQECLDMMEQMKKQQHGLARQISLS